MPKKYVQVHDIMAKRPFCGYCVYCLKVHGRLTRDHVIPESWYPDTTPANLEKWKVPSCEKCNSEYGRVEENLLTWVGLCIDPKNSQGSGIAEKVLRSIKPEYAISEGDKAARKAKLLKVLRKTFIAKKPLDHGVLPGFESYGGKYPALAIMIPESDIRKLCEKVVRGVTYVLEKRLIQQDYIIEMHIVSNTVANNVFAPMAQFGKVYARGPGFQMWRAVTKDDPGTALLALEFFGKLKLYASVIKHD